MVRPPAPRTNSVSSLRWCWGPTGCDCGWLGTQGGWAAAGGTRRPHSWWRVPDHAGPLQTLAPLGVRALLRVGPRPGTPSFLWPRAPLLALPSLQPPAGCPGQDGGRGQLGKFPPSDRPPPHPHGWGRSAAGTGLGASFCGAPLPPEAGAGWRSPPPCPPHPVQSPQSPAAAECSPQGVGGLAPIPGAAPSAHCIQTPTQRCAASPWVGEPADIRAGCIWPLLCTDGETEAQERRRLAPGEQ